MLWTATARWGRSGLQLLWRGRAVPSFASRLSPQHVAMFQPLCQERGVQRRAVAAATDNATVSEFLDWLLPKLNGFGGGGGPAAADADGATEGGGYASPDYSYSGSEGEGGEDADSGRMAGSEDEAEEGGSDEEMGEAGDSGGCWCCIRCVAQPCLVCPCPATHEHCWVFGDGGLACQAAEACIVCRQPDIFFALPRPASRCGDRGGAERGRV